MFWEMHGKGDVCLVLSRSGYLREGIVLATVESPALCHEERKFHLDPTYRSGDMEFQSIFVLFRNWELKKRILGYN